MHSFQLITCLHNLFREILLWSLTLTGSEVLHIHRPKEDVLSTLSRLKTPKFILKIQFEIFVCRMVVILWRGCN